MNDNIKPAQKNNNFEVHLSHPIDLNAGAKIALANISFPNRIDSIPLSVFDKKIKVSTDPFNQEIEVELGQQKTFAYLLRRLNEGRDNIVCNFVKFDQVGKTKESTDMFFQVIYTGPTTCDDEFKLHVVPAM